MYKAPFPANARIQIQISFQEQLDWKATDTIDIDIIRHNNADLETDPAVTGLYGYSSTMRPTPVSLADMLTVMSEHVPDFTQLLLKPRSTVNKIRKKRGFYLFL